jgi:hypothetical protein
MIARIPKARTRDYRLMLIKQAHLRAIDRQTKKQEATAMLAALSTETMPKLTEMQVGILARGMNVKQFKLIGSEAGKSSGYLMARGMIKPTSKGVYTLTDYGRAVYQMVLDGHAKALDMTAPLIDAVSGLNINDPSLYVMDSPGAKRATEIERLNKTIDEMDRLLSQYTEEIKTLNRKIDERDLRIEALIRDNDRLKMKGKAS